MCGFSAASGMIVIPNNQLGAYSVTPNTTVNFLVRATADNPPPASAQYALAMAAPGTATSIDNLKVWNNERLSKLLLLAKTSPPATSTSVKAHSNISFSGYLKDADGSTVPFSPVRIDFFSRAQQESRSFTRLVSDENGFFKGSLTLPGCINQQEPALNVHNRVYSGTPSNPSMWWNIFYDLGHFEVSLEDKNGVIKLTPEIDGSFYHICQEELVKMCFYEKNYETGGTKQTCLK